MTGPTREELAALAAPFPADRVSWKPQAVSKDEMKALAVAYVDARDVAERLDEVIGGEWEFHWTPVDGSGKHEALGSLTIRNVVREDVGEAGEGEFGDTWKAAVSDALKRAAVLFGVGRYLYRIPAVWVEYDAQRSRLAATPSLPSWALPGGSGENPSPRQQQTAPPSEQGEGAWVYTIPTDIDTSSLRQETQEVEEYDFAIGKAETAGQFGKPKEYWDACTLAIKEGRGKSFKKKSRNGKEMDAWAITLIRYWLPATMKPAPQSGSPAEEWDWAALFLPMNKAGITQGVFLQELGVKAIAALKDNFTWPNLLLARDVMLKAKARKLTLAQVHKVLGVASVAMFEGNAEDADALFASFAEYESGPEDESVPF